MSQAVKMVWPTESKTITQQYGNKNPRYVRGYHTGLDIAGEYGARVFAAHDGRVIKASWGGAYGNEVIIQHPSGLVTSYHHLTRDVVTVGQGVSAGTTIGTVGSTGNSTGPHLHFEVRVNNQPVNPNPYLNGAGVVPVGNNPVIPDVVEGPADAFIGIMTWLSDTKNWYRIGLILLGAILILVALIGAAKATALGKTVGKAAVGAVKGGVKRGGKSGN